MSKHTLTIDPPIPDSDDQEWSISCDYPDQCHGDQTCRKYHGNARRNADDGPDQCDEDAPWAEQEEFVFHGEVHTWHNGFGWTTPFPGCIVSFNVHEWSGPPEELMYEDAEGFNVLRAGKYVCEDDWYDESDCQLEIVEVIS